jgi:hypothetical protein
LLGELDGEGEERARRDVAQRARAPEREGEAEGDEEQDVLDDFAERFVAVEQGQGPVARQRAAGGAERGDEDGEDGEGYGSASLQCVSRGRRARRAR